MNRTQGTVLSIGLLAGLIIKYRMLLYMGVFDMNAYYDWGGRTLEIGLRESYLGIYFPLQYQIFEFCAWHTIRSGAEFFVVFKAANLVFDLGSFLLLVSLLRRAGRNPLYGLLYWLHPWFLTIFSLGYVDFQFSFFVLLTVWLLRGETSWDYLLSGFALGCAFLMKPQAQILVVAVSFFCVCRYWRCRDLRPFAMLLGSALLFLGYEIFFTAQRPTYAAAMILPSSYLNISNIMPALTAQMTNVWYPVAYLLKSHGQPIYSVSDQIKLLPFLSVKYLAAGAVLGAIGIHVYSVERTIGLSTAATFIRIFGFAAMLVPFIMTSGHENHLFLGTVFLVLLLARPGSISLGLAGQVLLLVQFLHVFSLYGITPVGLAAIMHRTQSDEMAIGYSAVSLACFAFLIKAFWLRLR